VSVLRHHCRVADSVQIHHRYANAGDMSAGGTAAKATICRCGAVFNRELTPNGYQQISWGERPEVIYAALDRAIVAKLKERYQS
jgi:hypothetical protein